MLSTFTRNQLPILMIILIKMEILERLVYIRTATTVARETTAVPTIAAVLESEIINCRINIYKLKTKLAVIRF